MSPVPHKKPYIRVEAFIFVTVLMGIIEMSDTKRLLSTSEVLRILNIPSYRLDYLFKSRKLKAEDFTTLGNGHRIYGQSDLNKIRQALFEVMAK